jgi:hypothetical protein
MGRNKKGKKLMDFFSFKDKSSEAAAETILVFKKGGRDEKRTV